MQQPELNIIISGGGTGGHIFPALAIADEIRKLVPESNFLFVGAKGKMEMEKVPAAGYKIIGLPIAGLQRKLSLKNLTFPFKVFSSWLKAKRIIKEFKPDVAIGVGGYASGPLLFAASNKNIPCLIQEQNSFAGITNRILGKKVDRICVAFEGMEKFFPKEKIVLTGNPVRENVVNIKGKKDEAIRFFQLDSSQKTLLIVGGSLGSWAINEAIETSLAEWKNHGFQIVWQTGKLFYDRAKKSAEGMSWVKVHEFIFKMDFAYSVADLIISRAGAIAVSEISLVKKPSILIPLPSAAEDHQTKNALKLAEKKAAILLKQEEAKNKLGAKVLELMADDQKLNAIADNMVPLGFKKAASAIAEEVLKLVKAK